MDWYYIENGQRIGPVSEEAFERELRNGKILPETMVWHEGMENWKAFGAVKNAAETGGVAVADHPPEAAASERFCTICGKAYAPDALIRYKENLICWSCKPVFLQRIKEGVSVAGTMNYAGFWPRVGAKLIDSVLIGIANYLTGAVYGAFNPGTQDTKRFGVFMAGQAVILLINIAFAVWYGTWFIGKFAATPGKMALGIKVVTSDGGTVSYKRALGRHFAEWISGIILGIGYLMAAFDDQKRALHDRICDTRVVRK
ncbi:MAG: RDD family protein [Deltaproteobacteria bacterium]|nr:RDD family protein [Deltaproteobacteria bacterium]